jgi:hypothetical protein
MDLVAHIYELQLGGLLFDSISLLTYRYCGHEPSKDPKAELLTVDEDEEVVKPDELTCMPPLQTDCIYIIYIMTPE